MTVECWTMGDDKPYLFVTQAKGRRRALVSSNGLNLAKLHLTTEIQPKLMI